MKTFTAQKKLIFVVAIIFIFCISRAVFHSHKSNHLRSSVNPKINVNVVQLKFNDVPEYVKAIGSLYAKNKVDISPEMAGQIKSIMFHDGDTVFAGQVLYKLDDALYKAKLQAARSDLAFNKITYQRMVKLRNSGAISKEMIDQARSNYLDSVSKLNVIMVGLNNTEIKAPFSGVMAASRVSVGQYVTPGESLSSLIDKKNLIVQFSVPENALNQIAKNQVVRLSVSHLPNEFFYGVVNYISPSIDPNTRTITVWADVPNIKNTLVPGLFVHVILTIGIKKNVVLVPQEALIPTVEGNNVFVVKNGKAYQQSIVVGEEVHDDTVLLKGLNVGDMVVVRGQEKLTSGSAVRVLPK